MCGIVGVASNGPMTPQMKEFFQSLLFHDVERGHHATGVAAIDTMSRDLTVEKKAVPSPQFLEDKDVMESLFAHKHNFNIYIGHNRWATVGAKDDDANAHPFIHGDVVGVHNGSLRNQSLLDDSKSFVVDSDNLYHQLNKTGLDDTLTKTDGAFALNWYDKSNNSLNFIRNSERPLSIGQLSNGSWVWASEYEMLRWLVSRHKSLSWATYKENGNDYIKLFRLEEGQHMRFEFGNNLRTIPEPRLVKKTFTVFPTISRYSNYNWPDYDTTSSRTTYTRPSSYENFSSLTINKFLKGADMKSVLELKFIGIAEEKTSTGFVGRLALFEYQSANGMVVCLHQFCHGGNVCKDWTEDKIGTTVYGMLGSVIAKGPSTYKCILNKELDCTISVCNLTETKPNKYYAYCDDDVVAANKAAKEGANHNVVPFREQAPATTGTQKSESSVISAAETTEQIVERLQNMLDEEDKSGVDLEKKSPVAFKADQKALPIVLANGRMNLEDYIEAATLNAARCAECGQYLSPIPMAQQYLKAHFDLDAGSTFQYLACSIGCYKKVVASCEALDSEYEKKYGGLDD